jgi:hypothetical protein
MAVGQGFVGHGTAKGKFPLPLLIGGLESNCFLPQLQSRCQSLLIVLGFLLEVGS